MALFINKYVYNFIRNINNKDCMHFVSALVGFVQENEQTNEG